MAIMTLAVMAVIPTGQFWLFLGCFLLLFAAAGAGNGSTYRMVPVVFALRGSGDAATGGDVSSKRKAAAALGLISAIGAYGGFLIPQALNLSQQATGSYTGAFFVLRPRLHRAAGPHGAGLRPHAQRRIPDLTPMTQTTTGVAASTDTHCPYCALQCAMTLTRAEDAAEGAAPVVVSGRDFPTNRGGLCKKGWTSAELLRSPDRLSTPLVRGADGELHETDWDAALDLIADRVRDDPRRTRSRRRRRVRRRRPHEREGLPARQVRPARSRHEPDRLQRPVLHVVGRGRGQPGLRHRPRSALPAERPRRGIHDPPARHERRRDDAAVHRAPRRRPGRGRAHRGRPAPDGDRTPDRRWSRHPSAADPGHRSDPAPRPHARRDRRRTDGCRLPRRPHGGLRRAAAQRGRMVARAGAVGHRRARLDDPGGRPTAGRRRRGLHPHRAGRGAARGRHRHRDRRDQSRRSPSACPGGPTRDTARSPVRATARADASTARSATSCPATARSPTPPRVPTSPRSGASTPR